MRRFRRILHASDFSAASRRALDDAVGLAKDADAELTIVHVLEPVAAFFEDSYVSTKAYDRLVRSQRAEAAKRAEPLVRRAQAAGVRARSRLVDGNPREAIAREAKRSRADLVVIGTHGRTGLRKFLLGSVAAGVVATSPCPVLTVRGR